MESGKNSNNKNKNENDISTVLVLNRSQFVSQKCGFQMIIKIINFKTLHSSSTLCSHLLNLTGSFDKKANFIVAFILSSLEQRFQGLGCGFHEWVVVWLRTRLYGDPSFPPFSSQRLAEKTYILKCDSFAHAMQHSNSQVSTSCSLIPGKSMGLV